MNRKIVALLLVCSFMAGCADAIPDPDDVYDEEVAVNKDWETISGEFTLVLENNTTLVHAPEIWLDTNKTYGLIELSRFNYTAKHLSFVVENNSVIFHNYTFNMMGHLVQNNYIWNEGLAPEFGNATLHFAAFPFDVTVNYEIEYRIWDGRE
tara:strand:+ start:2406 stop:2861 length:456 start_codon:yes stop_codon:yes gene_type:complete